MTELGAGDPFVRYWVGLSALGALLSVGSFLRPSRTAENPRFAIPALLAGVFLGGLSIEAYYRTGTSMAPFLLGIFLAVPGLCWAHFLATSFGHFVFEEIIPRWTGDKNLAVRRTFDRAESLVKRGETDAAFKLYVEAAQKDPGDPAPRLAMADLFLDRGARAQAEAMLRQAADCVREVHARAPILFRISDLRREAGDVGGARWILQDFLAEGPPEPYFGNARERLTRLG